MLRSNFIETKIAERKHINALRTLRLESTQIDFSSNDYLGVVKNALLSDEQYTHENFSSGSTGSRLLTGNYALIEETEKAIASFHQAEAGLIYNSGYDANLGLLSCVASKEDTILYDYLSHASIRDGIRLSSAQGHAFRHNDVEDLEEKLRNATGNVFVVTESIFSMDGDAAPLSEMSALCNNYHAALIVDEAHATGVMGVKGEGMIQNLGLQNRCFARVHTFGKAAGCHGAIVLGSSMLRDFLINFSRAFIYTTALPAISVAAIRHSYLVFPFLFQARQQLSILVSHWCKQSWGMVTSGNNHPIQYLLVPGNDDVKNMAASLQQGGFDIRPIIYPTVPKGGERLRIVLHAYNTIEEINMLKQQLDLHLAMKQQTI